MEYSYTIAEAEFSITARCSLACAECGFFVPRQPAPHHEPAEEALARSLATLEEANVFIKSLALVGGEATLSPTTLHRVVASAAASPAVGRVELVSNGLTPQGLPRASLAHLQRVSISDYTSDGTLADAWRAWLAPIAPHVELIIRRHGAWDRMTDPVDLGEAGGQAAYAHCWFRRHCVTIERDRLFVCSRIPKLRRDNEGFLLEPGISAVGIRAFLEAEAAPASCRTCTPMAGLSQVAPGQQPDGRLPILHQRALDWFSRQAVAP